MVYLTENGVMSVKTILINKRLKKERIKIDGE